MGPDMLPLIPIGMELIFYVAVLAFIIHLLILAFHWFAYGSSQKRNAAALLIYALGGSILLLTLYGITKML